MAHCFRKVIGIDVDFEVVMSCKQNVAEADLSDRVDIFHGDVFDLSLFADISADIVIYDIPYWVSKILDDGTDVLVKNPNLFSIVEQIRKYIGNEIIIFAPPSLSVDQIHQLGAFEYQQVMINGRHDRNYIYLGDMIQRVGVTKIDLQF